MREVRHSREGGVRRPRERGARSGSKQERLGGAAGMGCGKTRESRFPSTSRKSPHPFAKNAKAPSLKRIRNDKYLSEREFNGGDSNSTHASSPSRTSRRAAC